MRRFRFLILPLLLVVFAFAACGGEDDRSGESGASAPTEEATEAPTEAAPEATEAPTEEAGGGSSGSKGESGVKVTGKAGEKPEIEVPEGADPPSELIIEDIKEGDGAEAVSGATISVHYVGALYKDGTVFDNSWDRGEPITFPLGQGQVIQGWDQGFEGMKVGGRRVLTIPASMAYGETGSGPIGPNEALVFVVDLEDVSSP
ncbi:MAG TPA: FKBP-type peptidyl-prolyl cis-trans isomerase [Solirubrobacter sp.]|jgi:peptidylprolyl isomerase|nr:FKBP-type peptidyl-prolyl cis-trans isomerase [Solirubrobacter sp.]